MFLHSDEFLNALKKFSDVPIDRMKTFRFVLYHKGGFQLPHIHNDGPSTLIVFFNFSKGWEKGEIGKNKDPTAMKVTFTCTDYTVPSSCTECDHLTDSTCLSSSTPKYKREYSIAFAFIFLLLLLVQ